MVGARGGRETSPVVTGPTRIDAFPPSAVLEIRMHNAQPSGARQRLAGLFSGSLRTKIVALCLAVAIVPLVAMGVLSTSVASADLRSEIGSGQGDLAFNVADKIDRNLFERYGDVQAFAGSDAARSMAPVRITSWMNQVMGLYTPIYDLMVVADPAGKIVAVNEVDLEGKALGTKSLLGRDVSRDAWFTGALAR